MCLIIQYRIERDELEVQIEISVPKSMMYIVNSTKICGNFVDIIDYRSKFDYSLENESLATSNNGNNEH